MDLLSWFKGLFRQQFGFGLIPQSIDSRDFKYKSSGTTLDVVDLSDKFPIVTNQGSYQSCTAHAVCALLDYYLAYKKNLALWKQFNSSEAYQWYYSRYLEGTEERNVGVVLRNCFKTIKTYGFVPQEKWDYKNGPYKKPDDKVNAYGGVFKLFVGQLPSYYSFTPRNNNLINQVSNALSKGLPVVFGIPVTDAFTSFNKENYVYNEIKGSIRGNHAVLLVGKLPNGNLLVRNSWGYYWGNKGYFEITQSLFKEQAFDIWTLQ